MAALPYQCSPFAALRYKAPIRAWRSATCVALAITSLMAAAITWTPVTAAAPCPGAPSPSSTSAANCQPQTAKLALFSSRMGVFASDDVRYVAHLPTPHGTAHVARKTVRVASASYDNGARGNGGSSSSVAAESSPFRRRTTASRLSRSNWETSILATKCTSDFFCARTIRP